MRRRKICSATLLVFLACWVTGPWGVASSRAQEGGTSLSGFAQGHAEHVTTTINGLSESFDLFEPSFGLSLAGTLLGPRFMAYEAGFTFFQSNLDGTDLKLRSKDLNYNILATLFPGRRLSIEFLAQRYTDELRDNLFLFNRRRISEVGGKVLLLEGERFPAIWASYLKLTQETLTGINQFDESGSELNVLIDRRNPDFRYHLGVTRSKFDSPDFGFNVTSDIATLDVSKRLAKHLLGDLRGTWFETRTGREPTGLFRISDVPLDEGGGQNFLTQRELKQTETQIGFGLHYLTDRLQGDADYDRRRTTAGNFQTTEQVGTLSATYRPSTRTTFSAQYSTLLTDATNSSGSNQNFTTRLSRRRTPNLVFFVEGDAQMSRTQVGDLLQTTAIPDYTLADLSGGFDYSRRMGKFSSYTSLQLGAGHASVTPGDSGPRTDVEARFALTGIVLRRINLSANLFYQNRDDASGFSFNTNQATAQFLATSNLGNRLQLRLLAFAMDLHQDGLSVFAPRVEFQAPLVLDIKQRTAEFGVSYFLPHNVFGTLAVGRTSSTSNEASGRTPSVSSDVENRFTYLDASLNARPFRRLELLARARLQRGFQLTDIQDDQDFVEADAIYHLQAWDFLLGYTRNKYILGTTDFQQKRVYFTVRRNFGWGLR